MTDVHAAWLPAEAFRTIGTRRTLVVGEGPGRDEVRERYQPLVGTGRQRRATNLKSGVGVDVLDRVRGRLVEPVVGGQVRDHTGQSSATFRMSGPAAPQRP